MPISTSEDIIFSTLLHILANSSRTPFENFDDPTPILYQSGYLTIKDFLHIGEMDMYTLGFPNLEVRKGFADCLYRHVTSRHSLYPAYRFWC